MWVQITWSLGTTLRGFAFTLNEMGSQHGVLSTDMRWSVFHFKIITLAKIGLGEWHFGGRKERFVSKPMQ